MAKDSEFPPESYSGKDYHDPPPAPLIDPIELSKWSFYRALIAEFVATLLFLYIGVRTVIGQSVSAAAASPCGGVGILGIAWAFGGMIFVLVYCTAGISGGHINPAVTFGLFLARKVSLVRAVSYILAQCAGAIVGVGLAKGFQKSFYEKNGGAANVVAYGYTKGVGLAAEIIGTFVLVYTVFSATDPKRVARDSHVPFQEGFRQQADSSQQREAVGISLNSIARDPVQPSNAQILAPLPIGFAVFMVHLATIPITGTGINPARSLGAAVIYNRKHAWDDQWIFWAGPFIGAAIAAFYYQFILRAGAIKALGSFRSGSQA